MATIPRLSLCVPVLVVASDSHHALLHTSIFL